MEKVKGEGLRMEQWMEKLVEFVIEIPKLKI